MSLEIQSGADNAWRDFLKDGASSVRLSQDNVFDITTKKDDKIRVRVDSKKFSGILYSLAHRNLKKNRVFPRDIENTIGDIKSLGIGGSGAKTIAKGATEVKIIKLRHPYQFSLNLVDNYLFESNLLIESDLKNFLDKATKKTLPYSEWIKYEDAEVYLRKGKRMIENEIVDTLEFSSISRKSRERNVETNPSANSTGFMNRFTSKLEQAAKKNGWVMYIENIMNDFLPAWYKKRGYKVVPGSSPLSMYKIV